MWKPHALAKPHPDQLDIRMRDKVRAIVDLPGVPAGTTTPHQDAMSTPGTPASASVGTSGSAGVRFAEVTARMRTLACWPRAQVASTDMKSMLPASKAVNASPVTLKGT